MAETMNRRIIYRFAWLEWGPKAQLQKLAEECAELAVAALHEAQGRGTTQSLAEELADVLNMAEQVASEMFLEEDVETCRHEKLARLAERLKERGWEE